MNTFRLGIWEENRYISNNLEKYTELWKSPFVEKNFFALILTIFFEAIEAIKTTAAFSFEQRCKDILFSQPLLQTSNRTF